MEEHLRNGTTTFSARNVMLSPIPCHIVFHQFEIFLIFCPRALDRTQEASVPPLLLLPRNCLSPRSFSVSCSLL